MLKITSQSPIPTKETIDLKEALVNKQGPSLLKLLKYKKDSNNIKMKSKKRTGKGSTKKKFKFKSKVIVWRESHRDGDDSGAWRFARVPEDISAKIKEMQKGRLRRGWGAIYARAKIKKSEWTTSIFPDRHSATYILPLKKQIRYQENLYDGIDINVSMEIWF